MEYIVPYPHIHFYGDLNRARGGVGWWGGRVGGGAIL
jgi:hypothetical protein